MTLKEKLMNCPDKLGWTNPNKSRAKNLEKIADEFAVGFASWLHDEWVDDERWSKITDPKELLKIYKKEKGL